MVLTTANEIYFPPREILLVRALQRFVVCVLLWHYTFRAFWAVWTLAFKTFQNVVAAVVYVSAIARHVITAVTTHPIMAIFLVFIVVPMVFDMLRAVLFLCLRFLGFRERGVLYGFYAANYQPMNYSGNVPRGPTLAHLQSQGMKGGGARYRVPDDMGSPSWDY